MPSKKKSEPVKSKKDIEYEESLKSWNDRVEIAEEFMRKNWRR